MSIFFKTLSYLIQQVRNHFRLASIWGSSSCFLHLFSLDIISIFFFFLHSLAVNLYLIEFTVAFVGPTAIWKTHNLFTRRKPAVRNIPQCLCFLQLLQNSLVAPKFCPLCHQSCRSNANWILQGHSFWQI